MVSARRLLICTLAGLLLPVLVQSTRSVANASPPPPADLAAGEPDGAAAARIAAFEALVDEHGEPAPSRARRRAGDPGDSPLTPRSVRPGEDDSEPPPPGGAVGLGWAAYRGEWTLETAAHLLNRTVIGPRFEEFEWARDAGLAGALNTLLTDRPLPDPPGSWATEPVPVTTGWTQAQKDSLDAVYRERQKLLRMWWVRTIAREPTGLRESMVHFWHDHFAVRMATVYTPQSMYLNNDLLRRHALGNFKTLARAVCTDPAMLVMLDGRLNRKQSPNENFAREFLELFTMGEGSGYTQLDVSEAARACTGWQTDGLNSYLTASRFDTGVKTILGQAGPWGMDDFVRIVFEQEATSRYVVRKLYHWFIDDQPAEADIDELARLFRDGGWEIEPVLRRMLGSDQFFDPNFRGGLVRDGVDLYAGQPRRWHVTAFDPMVTTPLTQRTWVTNQMNSYGHVLLDPPDVAGWPGHRNWINSNSLPNRKKYSVMLVDGKYSNSQPFGYQLDVDAETRRFQDPNDVDRLVDDLALLCFGRRPTELVRQQMREELLQGLPAYTWSIDDPNAAGRLQDLYRLVMRLPDYQLK